MTGEMSWIKPNGEDSNGETWGLHATVARALRCRLRPWDVYSGPYIRHRAGKLFINSEDGEVGMVCIWPGGIAPAYCEPITEEYFPFDDVAAALVAARAVLRIARRKL
ncbi:MAG: hypothetical protein DDT20_00836 [Firmicutes bacterium]|nr:hypothetical protein [Bacillota bacterium]